MSHNLPTRTKVKVLALGRRGSFVLSPYHCLFKATDEKIPYY